MKITILVKLSILAVSIVFPALILAQTLPVGTPVLEDAFRRAQLSGNTDSTLSFCVRPLFQDTVLPTGKWATLKLLPATIITQYISHHPVVINDGAMIPAKGFQTMASAGIFAQLGPLSVQLRPEFVHAANKPFPGFPEEHPVKVWSGYYEFWNNIDLPERFGDGPYTRFFWGQSSVRLTAGPISFGLSNENLWWGPGMRNSIMMTNSAPGFKHLTFNTVRPIKTPIGSFEFQLIAGRLDSSGFTLPVPDTANPGYKEYYSIPKPNDWVYLNGIVATYQPKWVPGLFLGATRVFQVKSKDMGTGFRDILPVVIPLFKAKTGDEHTEDATTNQIASFFLRWLWEKEHAEIYVEFGRDDHAWNLRDFFLEPEHSSAWIAGFRKMIPIKKQPGQYIQVGLELTHLENSRAGLLYRSSGPWYLHSVVKRGYTNQGQMLGAGIGPGSNLQTLNVSWVKGLWVMGCQLERYVHNNDFHYLAIHDIRAHWVDFIGSLVCELDFRKFLFFAKIDNILTFNYQHLYVSVPPDSPDFWNPGKNVYNFQGRIGVTYRL